MRSARVTGGRLFSFGGDFKRGDELIRRSIAVAQQLGLGDALLAARSTTARGADPAVRRRARTAGAELSRGAGALWELADGLPFAQLA